MLWVDVLNRSLDRDPSIWGGRIAGGSAAADRALSQLQTDLLHLRAAAAARTLGTDQPEVSTPALGQWLAAVTLRSAGCECWNGFELPALRAARTESSLAPQIESLLSTALVELLAAGESVKAVSRCHGLARAAAEPSPWGAEFDAAFGRFADLSRFLRAGWQQCPRLVLAPRQARYCSKACSNAAFAARKGTYDPEYFAAKQALYRDRQRRRASARVTDASLLFVD